MGLDRRLSDHCSVRGLKFDSQHPCSLCTVPYNSSSRDLSRRCSPCTQCVQVQTHMHCEKSLRELQSRMTLMGKWTERHTLAVIKSGVAAVEVSYRAPPENQR